MSSLWLFMFSVLPPSPHHHGHHMFHIHPVGERTLERTLDLVYPNVKDAQSAAPDPHCVGLIIMWFISIPATHL